MLLDHRGAVQSPPMGAQILPEEGMVCHHTTAELLEGASFCVRPWSSGSSCPLNPTPLLSEYTVYGALSTRPNYL